MRSYALARISTRAPNQNLARKLKSLGYLNFSTTKWCSSSCGG